MKRSTKNRIKKKTKTWIALVYSKVFKNYLEGGRFNLDEICEGIEQCSGVLRCLCRATKQVYGHLYVKGYEIANPYDTYGYESLESIELDLKYMSDRFADPKKLLWLLYVPSEVTRLKTEVTK
jgi:hypothetical protein